MGVPQLAEALRKRLVEGLKKLRRPACCVDCSGTRVRWKDWRRRTATVLLEGLAVYVTDILTRRVRCLDCGRSWTLLPPGLLPRKHYQPCVAAAAVGAYLFEPSASEETVAVRYGCSRRQVGRWLSWVAALASPADLQARLVEASGEPVRMPVREVADLARKAKTEARKARLGRAALVIILLEAIGAALGLEPPGLRAVLVLLSEGWRPLAPYAAPAIPIVALGQAPAAFARISM